jgi:hypothetical protein
MATMEFISMDEDEDEDDNGWEIASNSPWALAFELRAPAKPMVNDRRP